MLCFGERIAVAIIDAEMAAIGYVRLGRTTSARLGIYLKEPDLRARFMADAEAVGGEPVKDLADTFLSLIPISYAVRTCPEGIRAEPHDLPRPEFRF